MQIQIHTFIGGVKSSIILDVEDDTTIAEIKEKIREKIGVPVEEQKIMLAGRERQALTTVKDNEFKTTSSIHLVLKKPSASHTAMFKGEQPAASGVNNSNLTNTTPAQKK